MNDIKQSLADVAAEKIRKMIVQGRLELGEQIKESDLAEEMGLSKTPVREALLRLAVDHLVVTKPRKGTFVFSTNPADLDNLCSLRISLEQAALRQAMQRNHVRLIAALGRFAAPVEQMMHEERHNMNYYLKLDFDFHQTILFWAKNSYLTDALSAIATKVQALRFRSYYSPFFVKRSLTDHNALYEYMKAEDVENACSCMDMHVRRIFAPEVVARLYI